MSEVAAQNEAEGLRHEGVQRSAGRGGEASSALLRAALIVAILYCGQVVLIPIALAVLLVFVLSPVVDFFERLGAGRIISVASVVLLTFAFLGVVGAGLVTQTVHLADELPRHKQNIRAKVGELRDATRGTFFTRAQSVADDLMGEMEKRDTTVLGATKAPEPVPVVMEAPSVLWQIPSLFETIASVGLVFVLVVFMLLERRELRDRLIRLAGSRRIALTTRALDEAGRRISRYLLAQSAINATYGIAIGLGLFLIGVPFALLWGFLAAALRFIPYVGPWLGMGLPVTLALAVSPGWSIPLTALGMFIVVELITNLILEPLLYGQSAGVSQTALLVAVAFWTWLWGPVGLILATPLTVCVVVLCKYVPGYEFVYFLTGSEAAFDRGTRFYQRLVAMDQVEAQAIVREARAEETTSNVDDDLLLPALSRAKQDRLAGLVSEEEEADMLELLREIAEDASGRAVDRAKGELRDISDPPILPAPLPREAPIDVLGVPAQDETDAFALETLQHRLGEIRMEVAWPRARSLEILAMIEERRARIVCVAAFAGRGLVQARYLCRRLRRHFPDIVIAVFVWGVPTPRAGQMDRLHGEGANRVFCTAADADIALREVVQQRIPQPEVATDGHPVDDEASAIA